MIEEDVTVEILPKTGIDIHHVRQPINLKFDNLNVKVGCKKILQDVSGEVKPGEILAIMGPSGAGKSTLLNFLAGREGGMVLESGQVLVNNQKINKKLRRGIGYVLQKDVFFSHLTVDQTLQFVGKIRLPDSLTKQEKHDTVNEVINELGLRKCVNTVMGGPFVTGVSGGEKKRCSIAVELITNPALLIMDEPTSGLDSSTAFNLIQTVKKLAHTENRAVITTIHQPSSQMFHMFDKLLLLSNGRVAYYGKTNGVIKFFEHIQMPCFINWNPADFIMEKLKSGEDIEESIIKKFQEFKSNSETRIYCEDSDQFEEIDLKTTNSAVTNGNKHVSSNGFHSEEIKSTMNGKTSNTIELKSLLKDYAQVSPKAQVSKNLPRWPTGYKTQAMALSQRAFIQSRSDLLDKLSFIQMFTVAIMSGLFWFNTPYDEESLQDRKGVIFFVVVYLSMNPMFAAILSFPVERNAIEKERAAGMYRLSAYYTAKCLSELPVILFQPVILYTITYWMSGLNRSICFLFGLLVMLTVSILSQTFGLCIGASIKNFKQSIVFAVIVALSSMLLAGFYTQRMPFWLKWAKYLSFITYAYNILMRLEFEYAVETFKCSVDTAFDICRGNVTHLTGSDILPKVLTVDLGIFESFMILWGYIIVFRALFYCALRFFNKPR